MRLVSQVVLALSVCVAGCATIGSGTTQEISVNCNVNDAEIYLDGVRIGKTPFRGIITKNKKAIAIRKEGYQEQDLVLGKSLHPVFMGNIIIGGTLGSLTDFATGAAYTYTPASYFVELQERELSSTDYLQRLHVRKFAMIYMDLISADAVTGQGEYLNSLLKLVDSAATGVVGADAVESALEASQGDQLAFGRAMVALIQS